MSSTASIFVLFIIACAVGYIWLVVNKAKIKGKIGEFEASAILAPIKKIVGRHFMREVPSYLIITDNSSTPGLS